MSVDVIVIGAGTAGLACARALSRAGRRVEVVERSRGVGGRVATRRVDGQPVDHGVAFFHGSHPAFLAALSEVETERVEGWPSVVEGTGAPCQPRAFVAGETRLAFRDGVNVFPKHLGRGLDVLLDTRALALEVGDDEIGVQVERAGERTTLFARDVVLALAGPQSSALLAPLSASRDVAAALSLFAMMPSMPCATVIATYADLPAPDWHVAYPPSASPLVVVSHDSSKRRVQATTTLVLQAKPAWSRAHADSPPEALSSALLQELAPLLGARATTPSASQVHRWKWGRSGPEASLASPVVLGLGRRCRVGLAGELFAAPGGVEAAFLSGERLASRLIDQVTE